MKYVICTFPAIIAAAWVGWLAKLPPHASPAQLHAVGKEAAIILAVAAAGTIALLVLVATKKKPAQASAWPRRSSARSR